MKSIKLLLPVCLLMTFILSSCGGGQKQQLFDYLAVKTKKDANKISLIDFEGKIVAEDEFDASSTVVAMNGVIYEQTKDRKVKYWTLVDKKVKPLVDKTFDDGTPFNEDYAVVRDDQGILSLIDKKGNPAIANLSKLGDVEVLTAGVVSDGLIRFKSDEGKWGYANTKGEVVIKPSYNNCENFVNGNARVLTDKDEFQIIDKKGNKVFKGEEDVKYSPISEKNMVYDKKNGEGKHYVGLVDMKGEKIIKDGKYTDAGLLTSGMLAVKNDDSWGVVNTKGEVVGDLRFKFDTRPIIAPSGKVIVKVDKKVKLYSNKGTDPIALDDYTKVIPITKTKFIGINDDRKIDILGEDGKVLNKDSYVLTGETDEIAALSPEVFLNYMSVNSKYFNFDKLFTNTIVSITTKDIAGLNEASNIENVMQRFPYAKATATSNASAGNNYDFEMGTKSSKSASTTTESTTSAEATTAVPTDANDKFPGVGGYYYQTVKGASQFDFTFIFDGDVKTYDSYDANYNPIYKLNTMSHLASIEIGFGDKAGNEVFTKKMKEKLISAGWKTSATDTESTMSFTNGANSHSITLNSSKLTISFYNPSAAIAAPAYETAY
jgi:hypothetical protein